MFLLGTNQSSLNYRIIILPFIYIYIYIYRYNRISTYEARFAKFSRRKWELGSDPVPVVGLSFNKIFFTKKRKKKKVNIIPKHLIKVFCESTL